MSWKNVIGRVSFSNCDPIFDGLNPDWTILSAPPAWLTGHVMRRDCIAAPIPSADYAKNNEAFPNNIFKANLALQNILLPTMSSKILALFNH